MAPSPTNTQRLATVMLGKPVHAWVVERRSSDPKPTWSEIASELNHKTGGQVIVSREAIRLWYVQAVEDAAA